MFDDVVFDENLKEQAEKDMLFKSSDFKYYLMSFAFIGLGYIIITKFNKK